MLRRLIVLVPLIFFFIACSVEGQLGPEDVTAIIQTLTATTWSPTPPSPSPTRVPNTMAIVQVLNNAMIGANPLSETIQAKFSVIDAQIVVEPQNNLAGILRIDIECEWISTENCTIEESFVKLMDAFAKDKVMEKVSENVPATVHTLKMVEFEHLTQKEMIVVSWTDVVDYINGKINGNQLGSRIVKAWP